jgi:hypothetical protein
MHMHMHMCMHMMHMRQDPVELQLARGTPTGRVTATNHARRDTASLHTLSTSIGPMLSRVLRPRARAAALATSRISRALATKPAGGSSPFAPPPDPEASGDGKLTRYEELKQRQDDMAKMMMEKTMLEVNNAAKVRPFTSSLQPSPKRQAGAAVELTLT